LAEERCTRPGCTGKIVDGICEDCGRPPLGKTLLTAGAGATTGASTASRLGSSTGTSGTGTSGTGTSGVGSSSLSGRTGSSRGTRGTRGSRSSSRHALGAGLVTLPPIPSLDPLNSLMTDPSVPDRKRYCNNCNAKLSRERGFCPNCGNEYSFVPTLKAGDIVAGQYEVKGAIAFGGLGWIYLGWDKTLGRWVVLKGLLNSKDAASAAAAVAERQFLAAVKHAKIVGIYNFVSEGTEGYIVMEYVGGKTLKSIRQERGPLPVEEAIAYIYGILPAFTYLERSGLIYCDFKPDNFMLEDEDVKLIDMGGVRRVDDLDGDIYGTKGYSAPEANEYPSFVSDLYTVARTLAVLIMDFKFQSAYEFTLPPTTEQPVLAENESLYRWLLRSTHKDPDMRFQTADEMADQLLGVLREIVALKTTPRPAESIYFGGDVLIDVEPDDVRLTGPTYRLLPPLKLDATDPAAGMLMTAGTLSGTARVALFQQAGKRFADSSEALLRLADYYITEANFTEAEKLLAQAQAKDQFDWRVAWSTGRKLLAQNRGREALDAFDRVYFELPGELAPKLALGVAAEMAGDWQRAIHFYDVVSRTDPAFTSASFGLARCLAESADRAGAAGAFCRVPTTSNLYTQAQMAMARTLLRTKPSAPGENDLVQAAKAIEALTVEGLTLHRLGADLLLCAVEQMEAQRVQPGSGNKLLGCDMQIASLRTGAERELRACAHFAKTRAEKVDYVDQANRVRPRTLT
jgi:serine/threonine-protein kinase PknG